MANEPGLSIPLPDLRAQMGDAKGAVREARKEIRQLERELATAAKKGKDFDSKKARRLQELRVLEQQQRRVVEQTKAIRSSANASREAIEKIRTLAGAQLFRNIARGDVSAIDLVHFTQALGPDLHKLGQRLQNIKGAGRIAKATRGLGGALGAVGPAAATAAIAIETTKQITEELRNDEDFRKSISDRLLTGEIDQRTAARIEEEFNKFRVFGSAKEAGEEVIREVQQRNRLGKAFTDNPEEVEKALAQYIKGPQAKETVDRVQDIIEEKVRVRGAELRRELDPEERAKIASDALHAFFGEGKIKGEFFERLTKDVDTILAKRANIEQRKKDAAAQWQEFEQKKMAEIQKNLIRERRVPVMIND